MGTHDKLMARLKTRPTNFTFDELQTLLAGIGYRLVTTGKSSGSAVRFVHPQFQAIRLHKPHPGNELKRYVIDSLLEKFESEGLL